eukprot:5533539-Prorocentrum_lima.AAC.1
MSATHLSSAAPMRMFVIFLQHMSTGSTCPLLEVLTTRPLREKWSPKPVQDLHPEGLIREK